MGCFSALEPSSSESYVYGCDNCDTGAGAAGGGLFISPEFRGGGGFGGSSDRTGLVDIDPPVVCVRLGGGINLLLFSVANPAGRD